MFIGSCIITLRAEWVHKLKKKRMIIQELNKGLEINSI